MSNGREPRLRSYLLLVAPCAVVSLAGCGPGGLLPVEPGSASHGPTSLPSSESLPVPSAAAIPSSPSSGPARSEEELLARAPLHDRGGFVSADFPDYDVVHGEEEEEESDDRYELGDGDLYRRVSDDRVLTLSYSGGLELFDLHDPGNARVLSRIAFHGAPRELIVDGVHAVVVVDDSDDGVSRGSGERLVAKDPGARIYLIALDGDVLRVKSTGHVRGVARTTRFLESAGNRFLYVACDRWSSELTADGSWSDHSESVLKEFEVTSNAIVEGNELSLGGNVTSLAANQGVLVAATISPLWSETHSDVTLIEVSPNDGAMTMRGKITVAGYVAGKAGMDFRDGQLRVFSGVRWGSGSSWLQTFDAKDLSNLLPIDALEFAANQLHAAFFVGDRAFALTDEKTQRLFSFSIDSTGHLHALPSFVDSGSTYALRPVGDGVRLIGVGQIEQSGHQIVSVSLYDPSARLAANPLLARETITSAPDSAPFVEWDPGALTILEDPAPFGGHATKAERSGLILLPFDAATPNGKAYGYTHQSGVQLFSWTEHTLTRRGVFYLPRARTVDRAFEVSPGRAAAFSVDDFTTVDTGALDQPTTLSNVDLRPSDDAVFALPNHRIRIRTRWSEDGTPETRAEVIPPAGPADLVPAIASIPFPYYVRPIQAGTRLLTVTQTSNADGITFELQAFDFSDPMNPRAGTTLKSEKLPYDPSSGGRTDPGLSRSWTWMRGFRPTPTGLLYVDPVQEIGPRSSVSWCSDYPRQGPKCTSVEGCRYFAGERACWETDDGALCTGALLDCVLESGSAHCAAMNEAAAAMHGQRNCRPPEKAARVTYRFRLLRYDFTDLDHPRTLPVILTPAGEDAVEVFESDGRLFLTTKTAVELPGTSKPYARYFLRELTATPDDGLSIGPAMNVPGKPFAVRGDRIFTRDIRWNGNVLGSALAESEAGSGVARLIAYTDLAGQQITSLVADSNGTVLITDAHPMTRVGNNDVYDSNWLTAYQSNASTGELETMSRMAIPERATIRSSSGHRILLSDLIVDVTDPHKPRAQAATPGWDGTILVDHDEILVPMGSRGIFQMGVDDVQPPLAP